MRTYYDIEQMAAQDYSIGLTAHYKPLADLINSRNYKSITEVGTAYGGNAFHLLANTSIDRIICVDPYLFYPAMPGFTCQDEYDLLFKYAQNILGDRATFIRKKSKDAVSFLKPADLIFLDGSHDYEDVKWECENLSKLVNEGGVLAGHDWDIFEGVNKAVQEFSNETGRPINLLQGNIWFINY